MTTKLWITRTLPGAEKSAETWREAGYDPVIAPLLEVISLGLKDPILDSAELIFTSANGVRHLGMTGDARRVYVIGSATEAAARDAGFVNIVNANGDWRSLVQVVEKTKNMVIHISGWHVRGEIVKTLVKEGVEAERRIVYRSQPVKKWPLDPLDFDAVALYSPLAAKTLMDLPDRDLSHLTAFCLSEAIAQPLRMSSRFGSDIHVAGAPNEPSLIACSPPPRG